MFKYGRDGVVRYLCPKALEPTRCSLIRCCHEPGEGTNGTSADRTGGLNFDHERVNPASSLDGMARLIDWTEVARDLGDIYSAVKDEPGWRRWRYSQPCYLLHGILSDVKLAEVVADQASFR